MSDDHELEELQGQQLLNAAPLAGLASAATRWPATSTFWWTCFLSGACSQWFANVKKRLVRSPKV